MNESIDGPRNPFDLFGTSALRETRPASAELPDLMQHADDAPAVGPVAGTAAEPSSVAVREPAFELAPEPERFVEPVSEVAPEPPVATPAPTRPTPVVEAPPAPAEPIAEPRPAVAPQATMPIRPPEPVETRKLWVLRLLLVSNVGLMVLMLLLPHPLEPRSEYGRQDASGRTGDGASVPAVAGDPYVSSARRSGLALPDDALYEKAMLLALEGDFDGACTQLEALLAANPAMNPAVARLVHAHLGYYLRKAGKFAAAMEHETLARQEAGRSQQPEELLRLARDAELRGDGDAMRRAYAQFLLQEGQLSPDLRALIPEALLKIGDSYRVQADHGAKTAAETSR